MSCQVLFTDVKNKAKQSQDKQQFFKDVFGHNDEFYNKCFTLNDVVVTSLVHSSTGSLCHYVIYMNMTVAPI